MSSRLQREHMHVIIIIVQPGFDYALTIWGFTSQYNLSKVQRLQNRAARIITGEFDYIHVRGIDMVNNLKWMINRASSILGTSKGELVCTSN